MYKENFCIRRILVTETYCQGRVFFFVAIILRPFKDYNLYASTTDCFLTSNKPIDNNQGAHSLLAAVCFLHICTQLNTHTHMVARAHKHTSSNPFRLFAI